MVSFGIWNLLESCECCYACEIRETFLIKYQKLHRVAHPPWYLVISRPEAAGIDNAH